MALSNFEGFQEINVDGLKSITQQINKERKLIKDLSSVMNFGEKISTHLQYFWPRHATIKTALSLLTRIPSPNPNLT